MSSSDQYAPPRPGSRGTGGGRPYAIGAFVCAVVAVFFLPVVLGPVAIVLGVVAHRKGDPLGRWAVVAGVVGLAAGLALGTLAAAKVHSSALALLRA